MTPAGAINSNERPIAREILASAQRLYQERRLARTPGSGQDAPAGGDTETGH